MMQGMEITQAEKQEASVKEVTRAADRERKRLHTVAQTLAGLSSRGGTLAEVAHEARNMVTALTLYCELLCEPGVLTSTHAHYGYDLNLIAAASRRLVEKLMLLDFSRTLDDNLDCAPPSRTSLRAHGGVGAGSLPDSLLGNETIGNLQQELLVNCSLLEALAGPAVRVAVRTEGGARPVPVSREDLTRVLVNLVANAAGAMRKAGSIEITLREVPDAQGQVSKVALTIEDTGPGIAAELLDKIFEAGFTSAATGPVQDSSWPSTHRGLGLSISRSVIDAAGGRMWATNRAEGGARFHIELPTLAC